MITSSEVLTIAQIVEHLYDHFDTHEQVEEWLSTPNSMFADMFQMQISPLQMIQRGRAEKVLDVIKSLSLTGTKDE